VLGLDRRRRPPAWSREPFETRVRRRRAQPSATDVFVFLDTFTNYYNPAIGEAGLDVLAAVGCSAGLAPNGCCGRPFISQGLLDDARRCAQANTDRLHPLAQKGARFVFFEPSCLSAVKEDAPALLRGEAQRQAARVGERSVLFEQLVEDRCRSGAELPLAPGPSRILLHGHCHQKAMGLLGPAKALLARVPGSTVDELDAGCCGMAGSFGYMRDHYEVSRAIGERKLLPAARAQDGRSVLVASGMSCRHQVLDFAGVTAMHPAELLRSVLRPTS
jgi:Fe-S oxidoreductase